VKVEELALPGVLLLETSVHEDARGFFTEVWRADRYAALGIGAFVQDNHSRSGRGVLRGLHYQVARPQGKLLHVARGVIWDVVVELRPESPRFRQHVAVELTVGRQLWVPPGYGHGFVVLSDEADVIYRCTDVWQPGDAFGVRWDDGSLAIPWPVAAPALSAADAALPTLAEIERARLPR
jgi:dTDP-4-dehydrorhamnose 3,5-epimerase